MRCYYYLYYDDDHYIVIIILSGMDRKEGAPQKVSLWRTGPTHGSFLIRSQRGRPGVVLPLVISNSANH